MAGAGGSGGGVSSSCAGNAWQTPKPVTYGRATADAVGNAYYASVGELTRYVAASDTWEAPTPISGLATIDRDGVVLVATASGVSTYTAASGSMKSAPLPSCGKPDGGHALRAGPEGALVATCSATAGFADSVVRYDTATSAWSAAGTLGSSGPKPFGGPMSDVAFGPNGETLVAYVYRMYGSEPGYTNVFTWYLKAVRWTAAAGWGSPEAIAQGSWMAQNGTPLSSSTDVGEIRVRLDHAGNAIVVWEKKKHYGGLLVFPAALSAARYSKAAKAWVATADIPGVLPQLGDLFVDDADVITLFWNDLPPPYSQGPTSVVTNTLEPTTGLWKGASKIASGSIPGAVAVNGLGNAFVVSEPGSGKPGLLASVRPGPNGTWSAPAQLDPTLGPAPQSAGIVALGKCRAAAYWTTSTAQVYRADFR